jgi:hypothetical protein
MVTIVLDVSRSEPGRRGIRVVAEPADERLCLSGESALFLINVWREAPNVLRASITHANSGRSAMLQGNEALLQIAEEMRLRLTEMLDDP